MVVCNNYFNFSIIKVPVCLLGEFSVSTNIESKQGEKWWFSGVYGTIRYRNRDEFWEELDGVYRLCCTNLVRSNREIRSRRISKSMRNFDLLFLEQNLGIRVLFRDVLVCSRIDRFLISEGGRRYFQMRDKSCWLEQCQMIILLL